ncbi:MAG: hypothetical protein AAF483_08965 [Planctomycetota bacterium]
MRSINERYREPELIGRGGMKEIVRVYDARATRGDGEAPSKVESRPFRRISGRSSFDRVAWAHANSVSSIGAFAYDDVVDEPQSEKELAGHYVDGVELVLYETD